MRDGRQPMELRLSVKVGHPLQDLVRALDGIDFSRIDLFPKLCLKARSIPSPNSHLARLRTHLTS